MLALALSSWMIALPSAFAQELRIPSGGGADASIGYYDSDSSYGSIYRNGDGSGFHVSSVETHATIYDAKNGSELRVCVSNQSDAPVRVLVELSGMGVEPAGGSEEIVDAGDEKVVSERLRLREGAESAVDVIVHVEGGSKELNDVRVSVSWSPAMPVRRSRGLPPSLNAKGERSGGGAAPVGPIKPGPDELGGIKVPDDVLQGMIDVSSIVESAKHAFTPGN